MKTFNYAWLARTSSSSDQLSKDALCGFVAACVACSVVYPIDSSKAAVGAVSESEVRLGWAPEVLRFGTLDTYL